MPAFFAFDLEVPLGPQAGGALLGQGGHPGGPGKPAAAWPSRVFSRELPFSPSSFPLHGAGLGGSDARKEVVTKS